MKKLLVLPAVALSVAFAYADPYEWKGGVSASADWNVPDNWSPSGVPGGGDTATIASEVTFVSDIVISSGELKIVSSAAVNLNGQISGTGSLRLAPTAEIALAGANSYEGGTYVDGPVRLKSATAFGASRQVKHNSGAVYFAASGAVYAYDILPQREYVSFNYWFSASGTLDGSIARDDIAFNVWFRSDVANSDFVITGKVGGSKSASVGSTVDFRVRSGSTTCPITVLGGIATGEVRGDTTGDGWSTASRGIGGESEIKKLSLAYVKEFVLLSSDVLDEGTVLNFLGYTDNGKAVVDLNGFSQTANRMVSAAPASYNTTAWCVDSASEDATLTLVPSENALANYAYLKGRVSLVMAAEDSSRVQVFQGRASTTVGNLIVSNGVVRVCDGASFPNVPNVEIADGGTLEVDTAVTGAFAGLRAVTVAEGGKFSVSSAAADAFASKAIVLRIDSEDAIELGTDVSLSVAALYVGGEQKSVGTYKFGDGSIIVPLSPSDASTGVWIGQGASEKTTDFANWEGGYPGEIGLTFARGGSQALLAADLTPTEIVFDLLESSPTFAVRPDDSAPNAKIVLSGDILMTNATASSARTATLDVPVSFASSAATVRIDGGANTLAIDTPWRQTVSEVKLERYGSGTLVLNEGEGTLAGKVYIYGGTNLVAGGALGGTAENPTYVEVNPNAPGGSPVDFRFTGGTYNQRFQFIRTLSNQLNLTFGAGTTNVINGSCNYRSNYGNGYVFEEDSVTTFNGGWQMNWLYDGVFMSQLFGAKVVVDKNPLALEMNGNGKFVSYSGEAGGKRSELRFKATGNYAKKRLMFGGGIDVVFDVDFAFDAAATTGEATPIASMVSPAQSEVGVYPTLDFNGHSQRFGRLCILKSDSAANFGFWGNAVCRMKSETPAAVFVRMNGADAVEEDASRSWDGTFSGALSLVKEGTNTLTLAGVSSTTGRLEVSEGLLAFSGSGAMTNVSEVAVSGGVLAIDAKGRVKKDADYRLSGGRLDIAAGVSLRAGNLFVSDGNGGWIRKDPGRYTAANMPEYISGEGALRVRGGGGVILVR